MREEEKKKKAKRAKRPKASQDRNHECAWPNWQVFIRIRSWGKGREGPELERFRAEGAG